ncbi:hypothetical protein VNO77_44556 [Canavalia gladiata]|uniref:Uncharacterized protein n=1 Tax=Canavalia gladiata TaxID=3824 RepID=A0AAN9PQF9_CANGL
MGSCYVIYLRLYYCSIYAGCLYKALVSFYSFQSDLERRNTGYNRPQRKDPKWIKGSGKFITKPMLCTLNSLSCRLYLILSKCLHVTYISMIWKIESGLNYSNIVTQQYNFGMPIRF